MVVFKTEYTRIFYFEESKLIETVWDGFASSQDYRSTMEKCIEVLQEYDVQRWLGDYRKARVIRKVDQEWTMQDWVHRFLPWATCLKKMVRVNALDISSQISSANMRQEIDLNQLPYQMRDYDDYYKAKEWLLI